MLINLAFFNIFEFLPRLRDRPSMKRYRRLTPLSVLSRRCGCLTSLAILAILHSFSPYDRIDNKPVQLMQSPWEEGAKDEVAAALRTLKTRLFDDCPSSCERSATRLFQRGAKKGDAILHIGSWNCALLRYLRSKGFLNVHGVEHRRPDFARRSCSNMPENSVKYEFHRHVFGQRAMHHFHFIVMDDDVLDLDSPYADLNLLKLLDHMQEDTRVLLPAVLSGEKLEMLEKRFEICSCDTKIVQRTTCLRLCVRSCRRRGLAVCRTTDEITSVLRKVLKQPHMRALSSYADKHEYVSTKPSGLMAEFRRMVPLFANVNIASSCTQDNALGVDDPLLLQGAKTHFKMQELSLHALPCSDPMWRFPSCAVVGSSNLTLTGRGYGRSIDSHTAILRLKDAPVRGFEVDVGRRTTFRLDISKVGKSFALDLLGMGEDSIVLFPINSEYRVELLRTFSSEQLRKVLPLNFGYYGYTGWWLNYSYPRVPSIPSTGVQGVMIMAAMCDEVHLYGYGGMPPPIDDIDSMTPEHPFFRHRLNYYASDKKVNTPGKGVGTFITSKTSWRDQLSWYVERSTSRFSHNFQREAELYSHLEQNGFLKIHR